MNLISAVLSGQKPLFRRWLLGCKPLERRGAPDHADPLAAPNLVTPGGYPSRHAATSGGRGKQLPRLVEQLQNCESGRLESVGARRRQGGNKPSAKTEVARYRQHVAVTETAWPADQPQNLPELVMGRNGCALA